MSESKALILGCSGTVLTSEETAFFREHRPWGFILFARNVGDADQLRRLVADLRASVSRADAPVLVDQEGGRVQRLRPPLAERYPSASRLGQIYRLDREAGLRATWLMSRLHAFDLARHGISVDCLPVLDVPARDGSNVIGDRAYSDDPVAVARMGEAAAAGLKAGGVLPVVKHMPGHGRARVDTHLELAVVDAPRQELEDVDFVPFRALNGEAMAMTAHVVYQAIDPERPATMSERVISSVIREAIGFDGLLMSDDISMKALSGDFSDRAGRIMSAGCDVVLHCNGLMEEMQAVVDAVPVLSGDAKRRADTAMVSFSPCDDAAEDALRKEFHELIVDV